MLLGLAAVKQDAFAVGDIDFIHHRLNFRRLHGRQIGNCCLHIRQQVIERIFNGNGLLLGLDRLASGGCFFQLIFAHSFALLVLKN